MITITNIKPNYTINQENTRSISNYEVEFSYKKKITLTQTDLKLTGYIVFPSDEDTINLKLITQKISEFLL